MTDAERLLRFVRERVERHVHEGGEQWYVANHVVDCDADALWAVVGEALRAWDATTRANELTGYARVVSEREHRSSVVRAADPCVCGHGHLDHGRSMVDTDRSCFRCGCWAFTLPVSPRHVSSPPVSPLRDTGSEVDTARGDAP